MMHEGVCYWLVENFMPPPANLDWRRGGALHFNASEVSADEITAQFHRIALHRLLNSPPLHYTADKLHRLVNLRHDEFSAS